jgi:hypothetical protein
MTDAIAVLKSAAIQTEYNGNAWTTLVHAAQHLDANAKPERKTECVTTTTPWGKADIVTRYARGINFYTTPGHGGFKLSETMNKRVPVELREQSFAGLGMKGWYEEDCDAYIVIVTFSEYFTPQEVESARKALESYLPIPFLRNFACTDPIKEGDASTNMTLQRHLEAK